ncbi:alpha/beta fold hydrolase [Rhodoferax sp.]|uniref:alpha/beta fold hydrolase n=1 Tax=Rhodoferax sp. TaxID=50421 RepID=UPI002ACEE9AA|nr:alpha/beta fold hydrolase [Rhodoferax sp.]MDZ7919705.1 alpha/beta fold hydrolase [Rhodoferax sp.]
MSQHSFYVHDTEVFLEGRGSQTIVMMHGWPDTHRLWDGMVAALAPQYRCVRFTLPGFETPTSGKTRSLAEMTAQLLAIVDTVSPGQPVTLLMHDWGCIFGYELAMRHPERINRIVGIDIGDHNAGAYRKTLSAKQVLQILGYQWWLAAAWGMGMLGAEGLANGMTRWMARAMRCPTPPAAMHWRMNTPYAMAWLGTAGGLRGTLPVRPHCPFFYAYGTRKPFMFHSPRWLSTLAKQPDNLVLGFQSGHWVMVQQADALHTAVRQWLESPRNRPS